MLYDPEPGVAVALCHRVGFRKPIVLAPCRFPTNVQCNDEWWPFSAAAIALYTLRVKQGTRALCLGGTSG
jgi:hypothetical protein